jgi:hypothetical protein
MEETGVPGYILTSICKYIMFGVMSGGLYFQTTNE